MILESADAADNDDDGGGGGGGDDDRADTNTHQHIPRRGCLHVVVVRARVVDVAGRGRVVVVEPELEQIHGQHPPRIQPYPM